MTQEKQLPRLLDVPAAAHFLGISERALRKHIFYKRVPFLKLGARVYLDRKKLDNFLNEKSIGGDGGKP